MSLAPRSAATLRLIAGLLLALIAACADGDAPSDGRLGRGVYVPEAWHVARAVTGHRMHVVKHKIACASCHAMTDTGMGKVEPARCATCHEKQARIEHASAQAALRFGAGAKADCTVCHAFDIDATGHARALRELEAQRGSGGANPLGPIAHAFAPGDCKRCHAEPQGALPAVIVHGTQECLSCHRPHDDAVPRSAPCSDCHQDVHTSHAAQGKTLTQTCQTCHAHQHAAAVHARGTCVECHSNQKPVVPATALFAGGHGECLGCHQPHAFEAKQAVPCRSCHEHQSVLGGGRIPAHNACASCHAPHDVKSASAGSCAGCHQDVHPDHPKHGAAGTCVGCHDPHPQSNHAKVSAKNCSSCHHFVASDHGSHGGVECVKCHQPHRFVRQLSEHATCQGCHATPVRQVAGNAGHRACQGCHAGLPHRPEALMTGCQTCHQKEHAQVHQGHAQCGSCHEPHSGSQAKACSSCHQQEHRTAPQGHQACGNCHEPHSGSHAGKTCAGCHAREAATPHGKLGHACLDCHRPHGPSGVASPPACKSCHEPAALPGLHHEPKHQACGNCHSGHGDPPGAARQACLSCHQDRKDHFPDAPRCANCHLFTPAR